MVNKYSQGWKQCLKRENYRTSWPEPIYMTNLELKTLKSFINKLK